MDFSAGQIRKILREQWDMFQNMEPGVSRDLLVQLGGKVEIPHVIVIHGLRRSGKSTLLKQISRQFYELEDYYFLNFEDERLMKIDVSALNQIYQHLVEEFGERTVFFLDEIQYVKGWESFVRRMHDRGMKFYLTGSNAFLQESDWSTKLTGRQHTLSLFPFSFSEYLDFNDYERPEDNSAITTEQTAGIQSRFEQYLRFGGMPLYWKYRDRDLLTDVYHDVIFRDVVTRHGIKKVENLRELALYLVSNITSLFSYNRLSERLGIPSTETVRQFIGYLRESWLFQTVKRFDYSVAKQLQNPRKIYCIDNGIVESVAFRFSEDRGQYLENLVFLELKRRCREVFYYKTKSGSEVDFLLRRGTKTEKLIQVAYSISDPETRERELGALKEAMGELGVEKGLIITGAAGGEYSDIPESVTMKTCWSWLLEDL